MSDQSTRGPTDRDWWTIELDYIPGDPIVKGSVINRVTVRVGGYATNHIDDRIRAAETVHQVLRQLEVYLRAEILLAPEKPE